MAVDLQQVKKFWEENPLWSGESAHEPGSLEFFKDQRKAYIHLYDGAENPLGKSYSEARLVDMLTPYFAVEEIFYHFFPARALPFRIPRRLHRWLDAHSGFMIYAMVRKKPCAE